MIRNAFEPWHLVVLIVVIAIVFGWKKLPDAARSLGRSMRIFKAEVDQMKHDGPTSAAARETVDGEKVTRTETVTHTDTDAAGTTTRATHTTVEHEGAVRVDEPHTGSTSTPGR